MAVVVQVHVLERAGVVSVSLMVSVVGGGSHVDSGGDMVVDGGSVHSNVVNGGSNNVVNGGSHNMSLVSVVRVVSVMGLLVGVSVTLNMGLESVSVVLVVHGASVAVGFDQGVVSGDGVSVTLLHLLLDVSGVRVLHSVRELVVGGGIMMIVMMVVVSTVGQGEDGGSSHQMVSGSVSVVCHLLDASITVVSGQDSGAGHSQDAQDGDETESHCLFE